MPVSCAVLCLYQALLRCCFCVKRGCFESKGVNVLAVETLLHCTLEKLGRGLGLGNEVEWEI